MTRSFVGAVLSSFILLGLTVPAAAAAQEPDRYTVRGQVLSASTGQPLPGVQVSIQGTSLGTLTNQSGRFDLAAAVPPGDYTLLFSFIGRRTERRSIQLSQAGVVTLDPVRMAESAVELAELVVTGTAAPSARRSLGNTIESVSGDEVDDAPAATSIDQAMQGKVLGAQISQNIGQPGGGTTIRLRGTSSILGGADPLIVIDGVITNNNQEALVAISANATRSGAGVDNRLSDIAPSDIERIEVIKGAAAAALYGSRANNGVIQIFTRRGRQGDTRVSVGTEFSVMETPDTYDLNMSPFAGLADVVFSGIDGLSVGDPVERFDFQDDIFQTGFRAQTNLSASGGNETTTFYAGLSFNDETGIIEASDFQRVSVRGKATHRVSDWLDLSINGNFLETEKEFVPEGEQTTGALTTLIFTSTAFDYRFDPELGRFPFSPVLSTNPLDVLANWEAPQAVTRFLGNFDATARPTDDLVVRYLFGVDDYRQESKFFQPPQSTSLNDPGSVQNPVRFVRQFNHDLTGTLTSGLSDAMVLTSSLGARYSSERAEVVRAGAQGVPPLQRTLAGATQFASQSISQLNLFGAWLEERLAINDRLYLTGGLNLEAASAFAADERWQLYPRLGFSYVISEEPFWGDGPGDLFSSVRVRGAYGETGGQPPGPFLQFNNFIDVGFSGLPGLVASVTAGNEELRPERQREFEGGVDLGLFDDRAQIEFTYYNQRTEDLVLQIDLPPSRGLQSQFQNVGEISNVGVEAALSTVNIAGEDFTWRSRIQFAHNENQVEELVTDADTLVFGYLNAVIEGQPIGVFYGRFYERDAQGDIVIDPATGVGQNARGPDGSELFKIIGDPNPDFTASLSNTFEIGNVLTLDVLFDGRFGQDVANFTRRITEFFGTDAVVEQEIERAIERQSNPDLPPLQFALNGARIRNFEEYIEDGSYVKLREVTARLRLPSGWVQSFGASSGSLTVGGRNLVTWTDYTGLDPEINHFAGSTVARNVDFANTPIPRAFVFGLNFEF